LTTSSDRTRATARPERVLAGAVAILALACAPAAAGRDDAGAPVAGILAAYERATGAHDAASIEASGTPTGEGLTGTFHRWRAGANEREDEQLGMRSETTLRVGDRAWVRNASGNVRELHGVLRRHVQTDTFIDSGAFLRAPQRSTFLGYGVLAGRRAWRIEVTADGGDPETLWIDTRTGLPLRVAYVEGDGTMTVDLDDWHDVGGRKIPYRAVTSDGNHSFDVVERTTAVAVGAPIDPLVFAPPTGRVLIAEHVQTIPLVALGDHAACTVTIDGHAYTFLIDSGAQNVLLDTRVAKQLGLAEEGALEVRGATRLGGLRVARLPRLQIGDAVLNDLVVSTLDLGAMLGGVRVDGILGYPFFASGLVQLDLAHRTMRFGPPGSFVPTGERIDLDVDREIPEAMVRLDDKVDAPFLVDTGNSGSLLLYRPFAERHPELVHSTGPLLGSFGIGGFNRSYGARLETISVGPVALAERDVEVVMATDGAFADRIDAGNLGLGVLRNFVMTFDLGGSALYLAATTS
jgi:predicted aspartyl protease